MPYDRAPHPRTEAAQKPEGPAARPPHPATVIQPKAAFGGVAEKPPHPATVIQPKASFGGVAQKPPHPAKVAQPKSAIGSNTARPPHPATVVQPKAAFGGVAQKAPHPATVAQPKAAIGATTARLPPPGAGFEPRSTTLQPMRRQQKKQGSTDLNASFATFQQLLKAAVEDPYQNLEFLIVSLTIDDDHTKLYQDSVSEYSGRGAVLNDSCEITYNAGTNAIVATGITPTTINSIVNGTAKKKVLVVTAHGNLQWLFGARPGVEGNAAAAFVTQFEAWLSVIANVPTVTATIFSAVVLDSCWSGSEPIVENYRTNVDCSARTLSRILPALPIIGFNGKTLQSRSVTCYEDKALTKSKNKDYAENALIYRNGKSLRKTDDEPTYHSTKNLVNDYYAEWLGYDVVYESFYSTSSGKVDK